MKVMKKLLSVMLVALLLVSAVPFAASAAEAVVGYKVELKIYVNEVYKETITEAAFSEAELDAWAALSAADLAGELGLSYYNPETDTVKGFANTRAEGATTLVYNIWIETAPVEAPVTRTSAPSLKGSAEIRHCAACRFAYQFVIVPQNSLRSVA